MIGREALTVIDHNHNLGRSQVPCILCNITYTCVQLQATTKQGVPRTKTECDRGGQRWYAREVKERKSTSWMDDIAREVLEVS